MTRRSKLIGYYHAILSTAWFSVAANDTSQILNGLLGDKACAIFSVLLAFPLTWLPTMIYGFPSFPSMSQHYIWMSIIGAAVVLNGLVIGYCLDRILNWVGFPDPAKNPKKAEEAAQGNARAVRWD